MAVEPGQVAYCEPRETRAAAAAKGDARAGDMAQNIAESVDPLGGHRQKCISLVPLSFQA